MATYINLVSKFEDKGIKDAQRELGNLGKNIGVAFAAVTAAVAGAGVAIGKFSLDAINSASAFSAEYEGVNQVFGESAKAVQDFAKQAAQSAGVSETAALQAAKNFGVFASAAKLSGAEAANFATNLVQAAGDMASFNDVPIEETLAAIKSGLQGQGEPLSKFGILMNEATLKEAALRKGLISNTKDALTPQQKVLAANALIFEQLGVQQGDFVKYSGTYGNAIKTITAEFQNLQAEIGAELLPVAEEFLASARDLTPALKDALVPAAQALGDAFRTEVLPMIKDFTSWLSSPQGTQAVKDFAIAIVDGFKQLIEFAKWLGQNYDKILAVSGVLVPLIAGIKTFTTVTTAARAAMLLFNVALAANPLGALIVTLGLATAAVIAFRKETTAEEKAIQKVKNETIKLRQEQIQLTQKIKQGGIEVNQYKNDLRKVNDQLMLVKTGFTTSAGEANRFNQIRLNGFRNEIYSTKTALEQTFGPNTPWGQAAANFTPQATIESPTVVETGTSGSTKTDNTKEIAKTIKDSQNAIKKAQSAYRAATKAATDAYDKAVKSANEAYAKATTAAEETRSKALEQATKDNATAIARINSDAAKKLADIVTQSQNRLRDAFRGAVQTNIASLFSTEEVGKSVDNLVTTLRDRLAASRRLVEQAGLLTARGFSQTFVEQVVSAGIGAGNELAESVLNATPETQAELKDLFRALEVESESGMDQLASTIYEKTGLATDALKKLYADTLVEQNQALTEQAAAYAEQQAQILIQFDEAMTTAATTRDTALAEAMTAYTDALKTAAQEFLAELNEIEKEYKAKLKELGAQKAQILALQSEIDKAKTIVPTVTANTPKVSTGTKTSTNNNSTVVNVNVKTDSTQSTKQVGQTIAQAVNKYVIGGGSLVSGKTIV